LIGMGTGFITGGLRAILTVMSPESFGMTTSSFSPGTTRRPLLSFQLFLLFQRLPPRPVQVITSAWTPPTIKRVKAMA